MTGPSTAVGIDIGGGKILAAVVDGTGRVMRRARRATPVGDSDALVGMVAELAATLGPGRPVGVGIAGLVTPSGELRFGPNLRVERLDLKTALEDRLSVPVSVHNDATAALWAEHHVGAAVDAVAVVLLTLGTGVGGAYLEGERLVLGTGFGGEFGHVVVAAEGRRCPCGSVGCLEAYASGTAIGLRAHEVLMSGAGPPSVLDAGKEFDENDVTRAAAQGDPLAQEVVREAGHWLGVGLASLVNALDPELVVVGGGVTDAVGDLLLPEAAAAMTGRVIGGALRSAPRITRAQLGDDAGMIGAALLVLRPPSAGKAA